MVRASARAATVQYSAVLQCGAVQYSTVQHVLRLYSTAVQYCGTVQYSTVLNSIHGCIPIPADPANKLCAPSHCVCRLPVFCYLLSVTKLPVPNRTSNRSHQVLLASSLLLSSKWWLLLPNPPPAKQKCWSIINDIPRWVGKEKKTMTEKRKDELLTFWLLDFWSLSLSTHFFSLPLQIVNIKVYY